LTSCFLLQAHGDGLRLDQALQVDREADRPKPQPRAAGKTVIPASPADRQGGGAGEGAENDAVIVGAFPRLDLDARVEPVEGELCEIDAQRGRREPRGQLGAFCADNAVAAGSLLLASYRFSSERYRGVYRSPN
jgi:hypothetical protein